jgi:hypothetical protein
MFYCSEAAGSAGTVEKERVPVVILDKLNTSRQQEGVSEAPSRTLVARGPFTTLDQQLATRLR